MQEKLIINWAWLNSSKGDLIVVEEGCLFQPYIREVDHSEHAGDPFSIQQSGVFGALNLYNKLSDSDFDPVEDARKSRATNGLHKLIDTGKAILFSQDKLSKLTKNWFTGTVKIRISTGDKIVSYSQHNDSLMKELTEIMEKG